MFSFSFAFVLYRIIYNDYRFGSLLIAFARNPQLKQQLFGYTILGFALTEAVALFALMVVFCTGSIFLLD